MLPGSFALAFVMPRNKVLQIVISCNHPSGFKIKDDNEKYVTFQHLHEAVELYKQILKRPFTSTLNTQK